jgi:hypothetical protein
MQAQAEELQEQYFNEIIAKKSYEHVIDRMRKDMMAREIKKQEAESSLKQKSVFLKDEELKSRTNR